MKIVYESNTGHTRRYAQMLSKVLGIPCYPRRIAWQHVKRKEDIIYMSWLFGNNIKKYGPANRRYNIRAVVTVGMFVPTPAVKEVVKSCHKIPPEQEVFCLRGGFNYKKLHGANKMFVKSVIDRYRFSSHKEGAAPSPDYELVQFMLQGGDFVKAENLIPIIKWYRNGCKMPDEPKTTEEAVPAEPAEENSAEPTAEVCPDADAVEDDAADCDAEDLAEETEDPEIEPEPEE